MQSYLAIFTSKIIYIPQIYTQKRLQQSIYKPTYKLTFLIFFENDCIISIMSETPNKPAPVSIGGFEYIHYLFSLIALLLSSINAEFYSIEVGKYVFDARLLDKEQK